jgi:hypothetical protein
MNCPLLGNKIVNKLFNNSEAVFSVWTVPLAYIGARKVVSESCCQKLRRVLEMAVEGHSEEMARKN